MENAVKAIKDHKKKLSTKYVRELDLSKRHGCPRVCVFLIRVRVYVMMCVFVCVCANMGEEGCVFE